MSVRLSILLVVVLILIGGSVAITTQLGAKKPRERQDFLYRINDQDLEHVVVVHQGKRVEFARTGDTWIILDGKNTPVGASWQGTPLLLSGPRGARLVAEKIDDPAKYGLVSPQTMVQVVDRSGIPVDFHLGDPTPDQNNWYVRLVGSDRLFTVAAIWGQVVSKLATEPPYPPTPVAPPQVEGTPAAQATGP